ncbi:DUF6118 family protein [Novosphingobium sp. MBES04]|uniref:DUF6118 family protein n=1 Tax=Novosphingobium sp. MBES04 TaxID=1206458 RepID=UPI00057C863A|nr:DUF6118 family protein [Novosphingobium sp. MBES04]
MTQTHPPEELDAAEAFEAMNRRLAGMSAAIDGFAARFDHLQERDYSADLAGIDKRINQLGKEVQSLKGQPAMTLTPERVNSQIKAAAQEARQAEQVAWTRARQELSVEANSIREVVYSAREADKQEKVLLCMLGSGLVIGAILMFFAPSVALDIVPDRWHWREKSAVAAMKRDGWTAGERLMQVYDEKRWEEVAHFLRLPDEERAKFADCATKAEEAESKATCPIHMSSTDGR